MHLASRGMQVLLFLISLGVSLAVLANAASHWKTSGKPVSALRYNPSNPDARIRLVEQAYSKAASQTPPFSPAKIVEDGIYYEPFDSRLYSVLGIIHENEGKPSADVRALYAHSLALNPADIRALIRSFAINASKGNIIEAFQKAELVFRAWHSHWELVEPYIPALLATDDGYRLALERFSKLPGGPMSMLGSLAKDETGLFIARRLLLDWHRQGVSGLRSATNMITRQLVDSGHAIQAYLLFGLTRNEREKAETGYIYNGSFNLKPNGSIFDWNLPRIAGVGFRIVEKQKREKTGNGTSNTPSRAMEIKFLNTPVRLSSVLNSVRLPKTNLSWSVTYTTNNLKSPKPVRMLLRCRENKKPVQSIVLDSTDNETRTINAEVMIPNDQCPLQEIVVVNENLVESWQNRYSGSIFLHDVNFELPGS